MKNVKIGRGGLGIIKISRFDCSGVQSSDPPLHWPIWMIFFVKIDTLLAFPAFMDLCQFESYCQWSLSQLHHCVKDGHCHISSSRMNFKKILGDCLDMVQGILHAKFHKIPPRDMEAPSDQEIVAV